MYMNSMCVCVCGCMHSQAHEPIQTGTHDCPMNHTQWNLISYDTYFVSISVLSYLKIFLAHNSINVV